MKEPLNAPHFNVFMSTKKKKRIKTKKICKKVNRKPEMAVYINEKSKERV